LLVNHSFGDSQIWAILAFTVKSQTGQLLGRSPASLFVLILSSSSLLLSLRNWVRVQRHLNVLLFLFGDWNGRRLACWARRCTSRVSMPKQIFRVLFVFVWCSRLAFICLDSVGAHDCMGACASGGVFGFCVVERTT